MSDFASAQLVNDSFGDPGLLVGLRDGGRALLFDLGDITGLPPDTLRRITHVFVTHMHLDHFIGFDHLLRVNLLRPSTLHLVGPPGLVAAIAGKLAGYTWNLLGPKSPDFAIVAADFSQHGFERSAMFRAREAFRHSERALPDLRPPLVHAEETFTVESTVLDHGTPCLAFALQEALRVSVRPDALERSGLAPGPWLRWARDGIRRGESDDTGIATTAGVMALGKLRESLFEVAPGQRIAYVVDNSFHEANVARIVPLARNADELFIEAAFLDEDAAMAARKRHLCAGQAGQIAQLAEVRRVTPLHFSHRYAGRAEALRRQVEQSFGGRPCSMGGDIPNEGLDPDLGRHSAEIP